ncbi:hypothetical protein F511_05309 [Dorcoceras hygrometricum]|uniref:Dystroglycan-like n=1 Tax=Dorcoceras hygrometricum TaxID=472368 RepID=A0A2Z7CH04_9LAMI|nr:hypothetical protein F511_05309 [Dorcoceras hygrometricum]
MASSYYTNTIHVNFESVLAMDDPGMVSMFQALMASGLEGFLGCPTVIYEAYLDDFFENASLRDGVVVSTVDGVTVEISEQLFAETFELLLEGLSELSEIPKDLVFDTRSIVSLSGEPVSTSGKKNEMKIEFHLLCDILGKTISVKAGSFDALTMEKFLMLTAIICEVKINWNRRIQSAVSALPSVQSSFVSAGNQNVQLEFSSVVEDEDNQMDIDQRLASPTTTAYSSMNFIDNDILLGDAATSNQPSLPTVSNISTYLDVFRTLLWKRLDAQRRPSKVNSKCSTRWRTLDDVQNLRFNEFWKGFLAHSAAVSVDSMDFRKEFRELNCKVTSLDEQMATTRNDLLEFNAQAQETLNHITDQLSELIAYINRGGNDKKGEVSSSRPQPPPDDQNRGSGNTGGDSVRTKDIVDRFSGSMSR